LYRELEAQREQGAEWADKMQDLLLFLKKQAEQGQALRKGSKYWRMYDRICQQADEYEPPPVSSARGRSRKSKGRNLMERLAKYKEEVLRYALEPGVPFTAAAAANNQAERDIRPAKVKQKNAGCFRTEAGLQWYARIYSFLSTLRKQ
jgi:transposase